MSDIAKLETELLAAVAAANGRSGARGRARRRRSARSGSVSALLKTLGTMTPDERKAQGAGDQRAEGNASPPSSRRAGKRPRACAALDARLDTETVDVTLPTRETPAELGRVHPISQVIDELTAIFADMGFAVAEGPDIETDDYNFTKLNFPEGHPAREMHDTFYLPCGSRTARGCCCARTHRRCRCAPC